MMQRPDALIFDVDGTMWDSTGTLALAYSDASRELSKRFSEDFVLEKRFLRENVKKELGQPTIEIFHHLYPELMVELSEPRRSEVYEAVMQRSVEYEYDYLEKKGAELYEGLIPTLRKLAEHWPLFIVSNCERGYIELFTGFSGTTDLFRDWLCFGDTKVQKDKTMQILMQKHGLKSPAYIGDIRNDAVCAKKAGASFVWASYGFGRVERELCDDVIGAFAELPEVLGLR